MRYKFPENKRYRILRPWLAEKFGGITWKVGLDAGLSCPHIENDVGCTFCDPPSFTPAAREAERGIFNQVQQGIKGVQLAHPKANRFIAYFQSGTNTFGSLKYLREVFSQAVEDEQVVGLSIGTRPDCVSTRTLKMIKEVAGDKPVIIEYGLQSIHEESVEWMRRGHDTACFENAVKKSADFGFDVVAHVMIGFPSEGRKEVQETANFCAALPLSGVKIHNLHVTVNTPLADWYFQNKFKLIEQDEYILQVCDMIERLRSDMAVHRVCASTPRPYLVAPEWCRSVPAVMHLVDKELEERDSWQGKLFNPNEVESDKTAC